MKKGDKVKFTDVARKWIMKNKGVLSIGEFSDYPDDAIFEVIKVINGPVTYLKLKTPDGRILPSPDYNTEKVANGDIMKNVKKLADSILHPGQIGYYNPLDSQGEITNRRMAIERQIDKDMEIVKKYAKNEMAVADKSKRPMDPLFDTYEKVFDFEMKTFVKAWRKILDGVKLYVDELDK